MNLVSFALRRPITVPGASRTRDFRVRTVSPRAYCSLGMSSGVGPGGAWCGGANSGRELQLASSGRPRRNETR